MPPVHHFGTTLGRWVGIHLHFGYLPDLFSNSLELTVPMAERCYDLVVTQDQSSPSQYEILPMLFAAAFRSKAFDRRLFLYAEFLDNLKTWQSRTMMGQFQRFPFMFTWQGRLADIIEEYREHRPKKQ
jgi:hypothetical protein